ncbi:MAG: deoxyribonuclease V [Sedimentisphaerales bacterium]|nr:deoxyribonuclease V [Sedimentisphaerales bacterium]
MKINLLHNWDLTYSQAVSLQRELAGMVQHQKIKTKPKTIAGLDCAFSKDGRKIIAVAVVLRFCDFELIETTNAIQNVTFPYIPGLLSFREAPVCIAAAEKLKITPDVFMIDGQGIAHPRRLGLAAHLGLFFDMPTFGCAKSRLTGQFEEPAQEKGAYTPLIDKNEIIGSIVRTRTKVKSVFVSVGNKCILDNAIEITLACATKYRIPEPTRMAHQYVSKLKLSI